MNIPLQFLPDVRRIHDALAIGKLTQAVLDRPILKDVLSRLSFYSGHPTIAPSEAYETAHVYPVTNSNPPKCCVEVDVWIDGKRSDLTASYQTIQRADGTVSVLLDDLRVM